MAVKYLNHEKKQIAYMLSAYTVHLNKVIDTWSKLQNVPKEQLKCIRLARTYVDKVIGMMIDGVDPKQMSDFQTEVTKMEVVVRYKSEAVKELKAMLELDKKMPMNTDDLILLAQLGLASCDVCEMQGDEVTGCPFKDLFLKYNINPLREDPPAGCCPYNYYKGVIK